MTSERLAEVTNNVSFNVSYDRRADVLYISSRPADGVEARLDKNGMVWRYDAGGRIVGVTIMNFNDRWSQNHSYLVSRISKRFHLPELQATRVLDHALSLPGLH